MRFQKRLAVSGWGSAIGLLTLAAALATAPFPKTLTASARDPQRGLASSFGSLANQPTSLNVASVLNTFQTPQSLLGLNAVTSQIQARMQSAIPAGSPVWDGQGPLPGAVGTPGGFNPSFNITSSSCSIVPMTFYDVYAPSTELPTLWCGAISNLTTPALATSANDGASAAGPIGNDSAASSNSSGRAILFNPAQ